MASDASDQQDTEALRALLAEVAGVEHIIIDRPAGAICLLVRRDVSPAEVLASAVALAEGFTVHVGYAPEGRDQQRVRFVALDRRTLPDQQVEYSVTLAWSDETHSATVAGEKGESLELRTVAAATLDAVAAFVPEPLGIRLAGVKQVRAFDADLVVVSLYRPESRPHNLVGAVVAADDSRRAAVNAVLNALNRLLGAYLSAS